MTASPRAVKREERRRAFVSAFINTQVQAAGEPVRLYAEKAAEQYWQMHRWRFYGPEELARIDMRYW